MLSSFNGLPVSLLGRLPPRPVLFASSRGLCVLSLIVVGAAGSFGPDLPTCVFLSAILVEIGSAFWLVACAPL